MKRWFADSFYFFAILNPRDSHYQRALEIVKTPAHFVTTQWVLMELADGFGASGRRADVAEFIRGLQSDANVTILPADAAIFDLGLKLYESRPDKQWSLTDCTSFVVMRKHGVSEALTGDHHFEQAGFTALLKS